MANRYKSGGVDTFDAEVGQAIAIRWELDCTVESTIVLPIVEGTGADKKVVLRENKGLKPLRGAARTTTLRATVSITFTPPGGGADAARAEGFPSDVKLVANGGTNEKDRYRNQNETGPHNETVYKGKKVPAGDFDRYDITVPTAEPGTYRYKVEVAEVSGGVAGEPKIEADLTVKVKPSTLTENRADLLEIIRIWFPSSTEKPRPPEGEEKGLMVLAGWDKHPEAFSGTFTIPQFQPRDQPIFDTDPTWSGDKKGDREFTRVNGVVSATSPGRLNYAIKAFYNGGKEGQGGVLQRQKAVFEAWLKDQAKEAGVTPQQYKNQHNLIGPFPAPVATSCNDVMNVILKIWGTQTTVNIGTMAASVEAAERPDRYAKKNLERAELRVHNARQALHKAESELKEAQKRADKSGSAKDRAAVDTATAARDRARDNLADAERAFEQAKTDKDIVDKVVAAKRADERAREAARKAEAEAVAAEATTKTRKDQLAAAEERVTTARKKATEQPSAVHTYELQQAERERDGYRDAYDDAKKRSDERRGKAGDAKVAANNAAKDLTIASAKMPKNFEPYLYYKFAAREYAKEDGVRPRPGDIIFLSQSERELNQFAHVCILVSASKTTWITADGGGGLLPDQEANTSDKRVEFYDLEVGKNAKVKVPGILSTTDLKVKPIHGWVNLDELINPNYGTDLKRKQPLNWHSPEWRAKNPAKP